MWNANEHGIPEYQIAAEHWRALENAIANVPEFPFDDAVTRAALDYFRNRVNRSGGLNLLCAGIEENRLDKMTEGLALIRKHLGR